MADQANRNVDDEWEPGIPMKHIDEKIASHREGHRGKRVANNIENTLARDYVPDFLRDYVATHSSGLGYRPDDYISIDKRNFDERVQHGALVLVTFGSFHSRDEETLIAEGEVIESAESKQDDMVVEIGGKRVDIKGWQIKGVLKPDAKDEARKRHGESDVTQ